MSDGVSFHNLSGGGKVGALVREKDWSATALGSMSAWPRSLKNHLSMIFELPSAAIIFWGPDRIQLYNDGYSVIMGPRHPQHLGSTFRECWPEAYPTIDPWMQRVTEHGETVAVHRTMVPLTRFGFTEEAYFTFSFSPLRDDHGHIAGVLQLVTEVTESVLAQRRSFALHGLANKTSLANALPDAARLVSEVLADNLADLPFCHLYVADEASGRLELACSTGAVTEGFEASIEAAVRERAAVRIEGLQVAAGPWPEPVTLAIASPITAADQSVGAVLVTGISPRLAFDRPYERFLRLVTAQLATILATARAHDEERKRTEALAELDRAKTAFFSNVSHELRTPLTLLLGPLEEALADPAKPVPREVLAAMQRNALRLLKLVNGLLDFARLEASRLTAAFEPTDLAALTAGLAGSFQSLLDSAGLKLVVDCPAMAEPVWVDPALWEKIVLNLISNAFKFTFEGEIAVRLREADGTVHLSVRDTGTGIPAGELTKIFERFHRVKGARSRSFEGTGIGLALVQELVRLHGGAVSVESVVGEGTTFTVSIPRRPDVGDAASSEGRHVAAEGAHPYVLEATQWNEPAGASAPKGDALVAALEARIAGSTPHILVADDNADMRQHLVRLLSPRWSVETAEDGQAALQAALRRLPDLVLSDVMMPRMDGFALVNALRAEPSTSTVPIVLLSARAGEEAVIGGLETGADDYLVKPFAARELLARVETHLQMAKLRREWARELERANRELEAFSYSVSHDLRAPLRAIEGFSKAILEDYAQVLDDKGRGYLDRVRSGAQRMNHLIDDLLALSRITRAPMEREPVDVTALARKTAAELATRDPERKVELVIADGLGARADAKLVLVLLENLLGNAWKFTSKQASARIEVGATADAFFVRDDGAGFDMAFANRLFTPFQRLHPREQFEGTGIGLATVSRIVTRHGGRIWAESAPGQGAAFYFTLEPR